MSTLLYRCGKAAFGRPWLVISAWLLVVAVVGGLLGANPVRLVNDIRIDGTPAQEVIDDLAAAMPEAAGGQGLIAFQAPPGTRIDAGPHLQAVLGAVDRIYGMAHVIDARMVLAAEAAKGDDSTLLAAAAAIAAVPATPGQTATVRPMIAGGRPVPGVTVSSDGTVALFQFQFDAQTFELPQGTIGATIDAAEEAVTRQGITVLPSAAMIELPELVGVGEVIGLLVAAAVLVVTLGSLVAAGLPLASALLGVAVGVGGAFTLSHVVAMHSLTAMLALMLGLAVGIDYALFIVNRQRRLIMHDGLTAREAAGRAIGTAGSAVVFAGTTVIIALVALLVVDIQLLTTMSLVAAGTVACAVLVSLTLLPALLGIVGERIVSAKARTATASATAREPHRVAAAWARLLVRHRILACAGVVVVTAVLAVPAASMSLGLPSGAAYNPDTAQRRSYDVIADSFGVGYNGPLVIVAHPAAGTTRITPADLAGLHRGLAGIDGVHAVSLAGMTPDGTTAVLSVIPTSGPTDAPTADLVRAIRNQVTALAADHHTVIGVTGFAALGIDVSARLGDVLPVYLAVVLALSLVVLLLVFRSIVVPIKATVGFLLSVSATFGVSTAVFQWGWLQSALGIDATAPILSILPIVVTGVLYGLAMDYQVFLGSSIKEAHTHGRHAGDAVVHGFTQASRVVTAAAVIMTAVFAGFVFNPEPMIKQVGFALAAGICIDAFLIRMTLIPAMTAAFGDRAWWLPRPLARVLPDLDIEGRKLTGHLSPDTPEHLERQPAHPVGAVSRR
jgi:RND superfamily putative drug exporter